MHEKRYSRGNSFHLGKSDTKIAVRFCPLSTNSKNTSYPWDFPNEEKVLVAFKKIFISFILMLVGEQHENEKRGNH